MGATSFSLLGKEGGVCLGRVGRKKMELPSRLGLGTIYKVPLCGRTNLTTWAWTYECMFMVYQREH